MIMVMIIREHGGLVVGSEFVPCKVIEQIDIVHPGCDESVPT